MHYYFLKIFQMTLGRKVTPLLVQKKIGKKSCSGLIHNQVILSDKSDNIREILKKKLNTLSQHPLLMRPLHDFFPVFFFGLFSYESTFRPSVI